MWIALLLGSLVVLSSALLVAAIMMRGSWERMANAAPPAPATAPGPATPAPPDAQTPHQPMDEAFPQPPST